MANMAIASVLSHIIGLHDKRDNLLSGASMRLEIVATRTHSGASPATLSGRASSAATFRRGRLIERRRRFSKPESDVFAPAGDHIEVLEWMPAATGAQLQQGKPRIHERIPDLVV
jgi:hypothetical protein